MARVLIIGVDPDEVDFADPALPPGMDAETIRRGIALGLERLRDAGHDARHSYIPVDPQDQAALAARLRDEPVECVVVGGGVRLPPRNLALFEAVLNTISQAECRPAIALVARPDEVADAVARLLG